MYAHLLPSFVTSIFIDHHAIGRNLATSFTGYQLSSNVSYLQRYPQSTPITLSGVSNIVLSASTYKQFSQAYWSLIRANDAYAIDPVRCPLGGYLLEDGVTCQRLLSPICETSASTTGSSGIAVQTSTGIACRRRMAPQWSAPTDTSSICEVPSVYNTTIQHVELQLDVQKTLERYNNASSIGMDSNALPCTFFYIPKPDESSSQMTSNDETIATTTISSSFGALAGVIVVVGASIHGRRLWSKRTGKDKTEANLTPVAVNRNPLASVPNGSRVPIVSAPLSSTLLALGLRSGTDIAVGNTGGPKSQVLTGGQQQALRSSALHTFRNEDAANGARTYVSPSRVRGNTARKAKSATGAGGEPAGGSKLIISRSALPTHTNTNER